MLKIKFFLIYSPNIKCPKIIPQNGLVYIKITASLICIIEYASKHNN